MKKRALFFFLLAVVSTGLPCTLFADSVVITPNALAGTNGNTYTYLPFGETGADTLQVDIPASQLTALVGDEIDSIGFRLAAGSASTTGSTTIGSWNLEMSSSLNPMGSLSTTFANNIGPNGVTVYSGSLTLGPLTGGSGPNPFFVIDFMTPYLYTGGDLLYTLNASLGTNLGIAVDANMVDAFGDTVGSVGGSKRQAQFFFYPVTELGYASPAPEPSSLVLLLTGVGAMGAQVRRRFRRG